MKKRLLSLLMAVVMLFSLLTVNVFAEEDNTTDETETVIYEDGEDHVEFCPEVTVYEAESDYQVLHIDVDESNIAEIYYTAVSDCSLTLNVIDDDSDSIVNTVTSSAAAGESVIISVNIGSVPEYYYIDAFLETGGTALSETLTYSDKTREYQEFLSMEINDEDFSDNVIIDFGAGSDGLENFIAVSEDVKVVYVDSMDDVEIENDYVDEDDIALFSVADEKTTYTFTDVEDEEVLKSIEEGDKVLIVPMDDALQLRALVAAETDVVTLFDGEEVVSVTASDDEEDADAEYFDYARIHLEEEIENPDIDFSEMDEELELVEENDDYATIVWSDEVDSLDTDEDDADEDEEAELFGTIGGDPVSYDKTATKTVETEKSKVTIKDQLSAKLTVTITYDWLVTLRSAGISAKMSATNNLTITASGSASVSKNWTLGYVTVYGASFPIKLYAEVGISAKLDASATQTATAEVGATWTKSGKVTPYVSKSASSTYKFLVEGTLTCKIGVGTDKTFSPDFKLFSIKAEAGVQAGVQLTGTVSKSTSSEKTHECDFCMAGNAKVYYKGNILLKINSSTKLDKDFSGTSSAFATFHISKRDGTWYYGKGACDYYSYKVTFKVTNSSGKALSGVAIYKGSTNSTKLGTTGSKGTYSKKILRGTYTFKAKKSGYTTLSKKYTVSNTGTVTFKMSKNSGANETYYTIDNLLELTDSEYEELTADQDNLHDIIFMIEDEDDLVKLSNFVNTSGKDTTGLRFVLNSSSGTMDLSSSDFSPIGTESNPFKGELDGNSFVITGLNINNSSNGSGLFGNVSGAYIYNLGIENAVVNGAANTGILVGYADEETIIKNCYATGTVSGSSNVGGLAGVSKKSEITNCYTTADISGSSSVGGIVGSMEHTASLGCLSNSYSTGDIQSSGTVGGVVGSMTYSGAVSEDDTSDDTTEDDTEESDSEEDLVFTGIQYSYYLDTTASEAVGSSDSSNVIIAYSVNEDQAAGIDTEEYISDDTDSFAFAYTLKDALNA
ncbi:MAG: carboxypeptidase-like regulatory domain-containing protein [Clostridiales bacterium]|nr:carboxypeptidase-like regulatory domain-containing protein [Clostridiales bacterium]